jgi:hypothetical protein
MLALQISLITNAGATVTPESTEITRLIAWLAERQWTHKDLARRMKWSPTHIYGALGGAWSLSDSFRWHFAETFGLEAAAEIFDIRRSQPDTTIEEAA